ncbi:unnamed protein product, partial [Ectocarpus sp. 8 AP-2014]
HISTDLLAFLFRLVTSPRHFPPTSNNQQQKKSEILREPARAPREREHQQQINAFPNTLPAAVIRSAFFARGEALEGDSTVAAATAARTARAC